MPSMASATPIIQRSPNTSFNAANSSAGKQIGGYQLGDCLGKGAFGQVYRALNLATGETVAFKEIQLSSIPKGELGEIMSEIDLLKNLNHANIVKYKGYKQQDGCLYIILEFCENGSLHNISKRFGKFPENLVAVYISQVLQGLVYLHDQGVIHRDIKGANILTNKDGCVKLADFGVASKAGGGTSNDAIVGSPYWMAPEVIEQTGATTASDIWSVGCTVIELLEGKPPYYNLDPMPALFRIVQDDCPPIPDSAPPIVKDFLMHCFTKDVNFRISAKKLLRHPWMLGVKKQLAMEEGQNQPNASRPASGYNFDEALLKVQEWNEALKSPSRNARINGHGRQASGDPTPPSPTRMIAGNRASIGSILPSSSSGGSQPTVTQISAWKGGIGAKPAGMPGVKPGLGLVDLGRESVPLQPEEEPTDNWDDDFEEGIPLTKIQALEKTSSDEESSGAEENGRTIRPMISPSQERVEPLTIKSAPPCLDDVVEDYSDIGGEDDDDYIQDKVAGFKLKVANRGIFHPKDIKTFGLSSPTATGPKTAPLPPAATPVRPVLNPLSSNVTTISRSHARASSFTGSYGKAEGQNLPNEKELQKYAESSDEDYEDVFGKPNGTTGAVPMQSLKLNTRLSDKSWMGDDDNDEEDPFAEIDEGFAEEDLETNLQRDKHARLCGLVSQLIDELKPSSPDFQLREACDELLNVLADAPEMQDQLVSSHGMLAILEVLEAKSSSRDVTKKLLKVVNLLVTAEAGFLESFCLIGGIPLMMGFTSKKHPPECRLEASNFVRLLCHTSVLTLQMFIACRGLKVLVDLLDEDYYEQHDLVEHALNGVGSVFELQSPTTKNDFCRMFIKEGLLNPLSTALLSIIGDGAPSCDETKAKIIRTLLIFCQVSQSDEHVRKALGTRNVVRRLLRACELLEKKSMENAHLVQLLKAIKHLSMSPALLEALQNANTLEILVRMLDEGNSGHSNTEMANHIFQTCYNMCRLNKARQEEAAQAGIIPSLKRVIESGSPLKQFAIPILCDFANATQSCRSMLWQHDGLAMYIQLLADPYFQVSAMEAIVFWLQDETARVEDVLLQTASLDVLVKCFASAKANSFENLLEPYLKLCRLSQPVTNGISRSSLLKRLIDRLEHHKKALVRLTLLRLLKAICEVHPKRPELVARYSIHKVVEHLSLKDSAVLVRELARETLPLLRPGLKPKPPSKDGTPRVTLVPKKGIRRAASETSGVVSMSSRGSAVLLPKTSQTVSKARQPKIRLADISWEGGQ